MALPGSTSKTDRPKLMNVVVSDSSGIKKLHLRSEAPSYSHTHFVEARKLQRASDTSKNGSAIHTNSCPPEESCKSESIRIVGRLSGSCALVPLFDKTYRNMLKARNDMTCRPGLLLLQYMCTCRLL